MDLLFLKGIITNYWCIILSKPILIFCILLFINKQQEKSNEYTLLREIERINNKVINSKGYNNYVNPLSQQIINSIDKSINISQNNNIPTNHLTYAKERIIWANQNPILYIWTSGSLWILWKFYYSTRYKINKIDINTKNIKPSNAWVYWTLKTISYINKNRRNIFKYFRPF
jgi:hypothetical protein